MDMIHVPFLDNSKAKQSKGGFHSYFSFIFLSFILFILNL